MADTKRRAKKRGALAYIIPAAVPAALIGIYYLTRGSAGFMGAINRYAAAPLRSLLGKVSSALPFMSLAEAVCTAAVLWVIYHIIRTVTRAAHRRGWRAIAALRAYALALVALYVWAAFCWLWGVGYFSPGLAARIGADAGGVTAQQLAEAARLFADMANAASGGVKRDADGHFSEDVGDIISMSDGVFDILEGEIEELGGRQYRPKPMMYSRLYSRLGYTGFYFAFTGESNINTDAPRCLLPATVAHELAHQRGVFSEDEANFAGIAACVTSEIPAYRYSGALSGLMYLSSALRTADAEEWDRVMSGLNAEVLLDWADNSEYWRAQRADTGAGAVVSTIYDGFLKANGQPLGIKSYGACVNLIVHYFVAP
ncbi:MAG: DUF3810 domain-containing protein [Oscillospiraceae bacterium]|jgi:hypothetical protein|nr:DUF3810 domain-containing protein [Oscillospiraceae bacterium]